MKEIDYQKIVNVAEKHHSHREAARSLGMAETTFRQQWHAAKELGYSPALKVDPPADPLPVTTVVWFTDAHNSPFLDKTRFHWLGLFIKDIKPDIVIDGGDFDDMGSLCSHEKNESYKGRFKPAFQADLEASEEARAILANYIPESTPKHHILGNHEDRVFSFEDRNPEMYGFMQDAYLEIQARHGWEVTRYREYVTIEGVDFTHIPMSGNNMPVGGARCHVTIAAKSKGDICFGHTHAYGYHNEAKYGPAGGSSTIAINGGCYMPDGYIPSYAKGSMKHPWYGSHVVSIAGGRIVGHTAVTIKELEAKYAGKVKKATKH